jgi:hypothetical protein
MMEDVELSMPTVVQHRQQATLLIVLSRRGSIKELTVKFFLEISVEPQVWVETSKPSSVVFSSVCQRHVTNFDEDSKEILPFQRASLVSSDLDGDTCSSNSVIDHRMVESCSQGGGVYFDLFDITKER